MILQPPRLRLATTITAWVLEIGLSERMVAYMKSGEKPVSSATAKRVKDAVKRKIDDLKVLHKCLK
jgi:hypothetical protein